MAGKRRAFKFACLNPWGKEVGGQAVLGRQDASPTPWLTERHGYDPTLAVGYKGYPLRFSQSGSLVI